MYRVLLETHNQTNNTIIYQKVNKSEMFLEISNSASTDDY